MQAIVNVDPVTGLPINDAIEITVTAVGVTNGDLFSVDTSVYNYISLQLTGTWAGTVTFQGSNNNTDWVSIGSINMTAPGAYVSTSTTTGAFVIPVATKYVRARVTTYTSGSVTGAAIGGNIPPIIVPNTVAISSGAVTVSSGTITTVSTVTSATLAASANLVGDVAVGVRANATNAGTIAKILSAASTNATLVKATAGRVYGWSLSNTTAAYKFVKLFNKATAPVPGTDVPVFTIGIPANSSVSISHPAGMAFATGIGYSITNLAADADTTVVAASDVLGSIVYA
jgi:hypothetical protein